ncbi:ankyrin repeat domain-containing protein [Sandaracinobacteroides saxicola]|uniref:Ankyrin repeat domain-containing protein n=2 Tax=Sandaracinobacteroides saxicola TaxID=2759707 RepID=A0A7G5IMU9_9SPHN|nr:ankyrin repeat domain-containing protein [Sandaracinobacteroides saxicola]
MRFFTSWVRVAVAAIAFALVVTPAAAQFSDSFNFLKAVREKDVLKAKGFLDKPGSVLVNTKDRTTGEAALHIVTRRGDVPWMAFMLQNGADPNIRDGEGNTPLLIAAQMGFTDGIRVLLLGKAGVDVANGRGETALIKAVQQRDLPTARALLEAGADPDRPDNAAGLSARDYAAQDRRNSAMAKLLADAPKKKSAPTTGPKL